MLEHQDQAIMVHLPTQWYRTTTYKDELYFYVCSKTFIDFFLTFCFVNFQKTPVKLIFYIYLYKALKL